MAWAIANDLVRCCWCWLCDNNGPPEKPYWYCPTHAAMVDREYQKPGFFADGGGI